MPKYIAIHPLPKNVQEAMVNLPPEKNQMFKDLKARCTEDANWIRSWAVPDQGKLYCEWDAEDPDAIREILGGGIEIEAIYEMHVLEGKHYEEKVLAEAVQ
jgi:hypothetical protein